MSHEYAHVYSRHVQKGTQRQYAIIGSALALGAAGAGGGRERTRDPVPVRPPVARRGAGQLVGTTFTRGDEAQADEFGFYFYTHAGWDPQLFGRFFQLMIDKGYDKALAFLSDHPTLASRVQAAKERASKLGPDADRWRRPPVASASQFRDLQDRAARLSKSLPDDKSLAKTQNCWAALRESCLTPAIQADQLDAQKRLQRTWKSRSGGNARPMSRTPTDDW